MSSTTRKPATRKPAARPSCDDQADDRVRPGPAHRRVQEQPDEQHRGQIGAKRGLRTVGHNRG